VRIAVVVPAFNEASRIAGVLWAIPSTVDAIVVVDDASTDGTAEAVLGSSRPGVRLVRHSHNRGVGAAIATGYRAAFHLGADVAVVMAGDGQMDPEDLPRLLGPIELGLADYVKGDRLSSPDMRRGMPPVRALGNRCLSFLTRKVLGIDVKDSQCGYTALGREGAARLDLDALWPRYGYPNDLLRLARDAGLRVRDVPVRAIYKTKRDGMGYRHAMFVVPYVLARAVVQSRLARAEPRSERVPSDARDRREMEEQVRE
jgi:glycosyltransferase involved in cell wall biosynthesis